MRFTFYGKFPLPDTKTLMHKQLLEKSPISILRNTKHRTGSLCSGTFTGVQMQKKLIAPDLVQ